MNKLARSHAAADLPRRPAMMAACWVGLVLALLATYSNHFDNGFHFDDSHTITDNPYVRELRLLPRFFTDARTLSVNPDQQGYRPLITASLALDYWLAGGLKPFWFHLSTFVWYLVLLGLMYLLYVWIMDRAIAHPRNRFLALFAVAWFALHPVSAETINYIWQRSEVYATLGVVAGLVLYTRFPKWRPIGLYLVPPVVAMFGKQTATMFAPLLFLYVLLFEGTWASTVDEENRATPQPRRWWPSRQQIIQAAIESTPAFLVSGAFYFFQRGMTSDTFNAGGHDRVHYWYTQPVVLFHYFKSFFLPTQLSADSDREFVTSLTSDESVVGILFLASLLLVSWKTLRRRPLRPIAFGLLWFLVASLPTSLMPLGEVENDHRMFFPFVGVVLAVCWGGARLWEERLRHRRTRWRAAAPTAAALLFLAPYAYGTHVRNEVWHSGESLWRDVATKSPRNGRGLMNYGLQLMARGDFEGAVQNFERAEFYSPNYATLHINLGVAYGSVQRDEEAEEHFRRALALAPSDSTPRFFYARWLTGKQRVAEAIDYLEQAIALNPDDLGSFHLLMQTYFERGDAGNLRRVASDVLARFPNDVKSASYLSADLGDPLSAAKETLERDPTPEGWLNLSLSYERAGRHEECIAAAGEALKLRPAYAEAHNNIAAAYISMGRWNEAIAAARQSISLRPDYQLARNNLQYALDHQASQAERQ